LTGLLSLALSAAPLSTVAAAGLHPAQKPVRAAVRLEHVSLSQDERSAQLTLQLSGAVRAHSTRLGSPERLVIDLPDTNRQAALPATGADSLVSAVRSGHPNAHTLRLVLELRARSSVHLQWHLQPAGAQLQIVLMRSASVPRARAAAAVTRPSVPLPPATASSAVADELRAVRAAHAPESQVRDVIIAVDAGHGGVDPGATGPTGTHEKNVTLAIARALAARLDATPGMHAVLTRDGDYFVPLRDRMERARAAHADLFVSIHADSVIDHAIDGSSVYILSERGASSEAARRLADQENAVDLKGGISLAAQAPALRSVLMDLSQNASMAQSGEAAQDVLGALDRVGAVRKRVVQQAAFVVLKSPDVPSMLVETAYISNPSEERRLRDPTQQQRLAEAIFSGIADYFRQYPPQGSLFARARSDHASRLAKGDS
jgi:N-acetylmuramoyl-L-alanine amidase